MNAHFMQFSSVKRKYWKYSACRGDAATWQRGEAQRGAAQAVLLQSNRKSSW